jgi:GR25 family glycosyltransferase involved in LPS biosynthesis
MKYTIIYVNDRAKEQMDYNREILKPFEYIDDIEFFNGNTGKAMDVLNHKGIKTDVWNPYDGRQFSPLPGEYGVWVSTINIWDYIVDNKLDSLLVLEDDVKLVKSAKNILKAFMADLPSDWDFLSLHCFEGQNAFSDSTNINSKYIHKSTNQPAAAQAILYSNSGAQKLKELVQRKGIEYTSDCFIFEQSRVGAVNGYSLIPRKISFLKHEYPAIPSLVDPTNQRTASI